MERRTVQREAIKQVFKKTSRPLTPQEILERAKQQVPNLGIATVYRTVKSLSEDGSIVPVDAPGEPTRFEGAGKKHHHHFSCRRCGRMFEMAGCPAGIAAMVPEGFVMDGHEFLVYGRCKDCAQLAE